MPVHAHLDRPYQLPAATSAARGPYSRRTHATSETRFVDEPRPPRRRHGATLSAAAASGAVMSDARADVLNDDLLIARARRGDSGALERLYRALESPVFSTARRLMKNRADAEEVLQETFLEVVRSIPRFRGDGSFEGWVRRIAASKALMRLRKAGRLRETALEPAGRDGVPAPEPACRDHEPLQHRLDLASALDHLGDLPRSVVWLHDVEGYTHEEIATMMGRTASFSKSQLARAHARLRELLRAAGEATPCT